MSYELVSPELVTLIQDPQSTCLKAQIVYINVYPDAPFPIYTLEPWGDYYIKSRLHGVKMHHIMTVDPISEVK